jgi:hypothetical protein
MPRKRRKSPALRANLVEYGRESSHVMTRRGQKARAYPAPRVKLFSLADGPVELFHLVEDDLETRWDNGLVISDGIEITEINDNDINQQLAAIYELTYKYDQINMYEWSGAGEKSQVLAICEAGIRDVAGRLAEMLDEVFAEWLKLHAITDPRTWAVNRWNEEQFFGGDWITQEERIEEVTVTLIQEYASQLLQLLPESRSMSGYAQWAKNKMWREIQQKIEKMPNVRALGEALAEEQYQAAREEYESDPENVDKPEKQSPSDALDYTDGLVDLVKMAALSGHQWGVIQDVAEHIVFPVWYGRWKRMGIDATRKRVEKAYGQIQKIQKSPKSFEIRDLATEINRIIQTTHQAGLMAEYVEHRWSLAEGLLDYLSNNLDTDLFDRTLTAMGVDLGNVDSSAIARRRQRDDAAQIVRAAWEDLAEEQSGRRNPRVSLQEAVIRFIVG